MTRLRTAGAIVALLAILGGEGGGLTSTVASNLTFFDPDFGSPPEADFAVAAQHAKPNDEEGKGGAKPPKAAQLPDGRWNATLLYSHEVIGFASATVLETPPPAASPAAAPVMAPTIEAGGTDSPTPRTEHALHGARMPENCARQIDRWDGGGVKGKGGGKGKNDEKGPQGDLRPIAPRAGGPWRRLQEDAVEDEGADEAAARANEANEANEEAAAEAADDAVPNTVPPALWARLTKGCRRWISKNPEFAMPTRAPTPGPTRAPTPGFEVEGAVEVTVTNATAADGNMTASAIEGLTTTTVKLSYQIGPTDDTFLEAFRDEEPLGNRDKLKVDATPGGVPTKVVQVKFELREVFEEAKSRAASELQKQGHTALPADAALALTSATLRLYSMTSSTFGGYLSEIPADWTEESAVWDDYAKGFDFGPDRKERESAKALLPTGNDTLAELGAVASREWNDVDLTERLEGMFAAEGDDDALALRIGTDSSDGVIYVSKEGKDGMGPVLELEFEVRATAALATAAEDVLDGAPTLRPTTAAPVVPTPVSVRPFKPGQTGLVGQNPNAAGDAVTDGDSTADSLPDTTIPIAEEVVTTSVVSSSFRMTVTAIETARRHLSERGQFRGSGPGDRRLDSVPTIDEKERPAIVEHLTGVFQDVLSIAPVSLSLVFESEPPLEAKDLTLGSLDGVIRKSVFRVIAIFDDPGVSTMQSDDAAAVLDLGIEFAFLEPPEVDMFIDIYKSHGERIVDDPSEYEVTVLKVDYTEELQGAAATDNTGGAPANGAEGEGDGGSTSTWLEPTLIAGASVLVFASSAAAFILWRQRRGDDVLPARLHRKPGKDGDTPRSQETAPATPSPNVFMNRFGNKKKRFDYAEFEDDDVERFDSGGEGEDAGDSDATPAAANRDRVAAQPSQSGKLSGKASNIVFDKQRDVSFDESSVSDVSAHILGAKGSIKRAATDGESFLLDTTMDSYKMEAMSALDQVRFEDVLQMSSSSPRQPTTSKVNAGGKGRDAIEEDRSHSTTGEVPSELYSDQSMDSSSMLHYSQDPAGAPYGGHLFPTLEMLRSKDSSLLEMPPPPSDAESDTSSQQEIVGEDDVRPPTPAGCPAVPASADDIANAPMRGKAEQDAVSETINDELQKVMKLLGGGPAATKPQDESMDGGQTFVTTPFNMDASVVHIGNVRPPVKVGDAVKAWNARAAAKDSDKPSSEKPAPAAVAGPGGINILVDDTSTDAEPDENDPLTALNNELNDCMNVLEKARANLRKTPAPYASEGATAAVEKGNDGEKDEESSLVTERIE